MYDIYVNDLWVRDGGKEKYGNYEETNQERLWQTRRRCCREKERFVSERKRSSVGEKEAEGLGGWTQTATKET